MTTGIPETGSEVCADDVSAALCAVAGVDAAEIARRYGHNAGRALRTKRGAGSPLHRMRTALGYSRDRIAGLANLTPRTVARIEEGAIAGATIEQVVRLSIVLGCAVTDIMPELTQKLDVIPNRGREDRQLWKRKLPAQAALESRARNRRKAVEWLWERVVVGDGRVRADHARAEYRDLGEPWGRAAETLHRARCELGMRLVQEAGKFGWWWETDHRPLVSGELPPLLKINDRVGRRQLSAEG